MRSTSVNTEELQKHLGVYLKRVREGHIVEIADKGQTVAWLVPLQGNPDERLDTLSRLGLIRRAQGPLPPRRPVVQLRQGSVAEVLIAMRSE